MANTDFVEELRRRGMVHDMMPGVGEMLARGMASAYLGIDPTADSLHIGHLVGVMMLRHFQQAGHRPIALIGGATGMIGDPSMKSAERNLLDKETLYRNQEAIRTQLSRFLNFDAAEPNAALVVNNYDWMKDYGFLDFIRDIGKHITVNYMMAKDSVRRRLDGASGSGLSFTEFSYQLIQGYDFLHLYRHYDCRLQMGGSDQWGNITTGSELIRRVDGGEAFALTCPLITKADGGKFGKTEQGNVWLDRRYTSPYKFYQFWLNAGDEEAIKYLKIFTLIPVAEIDEIAKKQAEAPHTRIAQCRLAEEMTVLVHSREDYDTARRASEILFGRGTSEDLASTDPALLEEIFEGVPTFHLPRTSFDEGIKVSDLLVDSAPVFASRSELRKMILNGGLGINKQRLSDGDTVLTSNNLIAGRCLLINKGKKNYNLIIAE